MIRTPVDSRAAVSRSTAIERPLTALAQPVETQSGAQVVGIGLPRRPEVTVDRGQAARTDVRDRGRGGVDTEGLVLEEPAQGGGAGAGAHRELAGVGRSLLQPDRPVQVGRLLAPAVTSGRPPDIALAFHQPARERRCRFGGLSGPALPEEAGSSARPRPPVHGDLRDRDIGHGQGVDGLRVDGAP